MASPQLTPLKDLRVSSHLIPAHNFIPNTCFQKKPLLIYHGAFASETSASQIESHLHSVGVVYSNWRYKMYSTTHFHSITHEVLCVFSGAAKLCFGGEHNPAKVTPTVSKGDVIIVPAGVGHMMLEEVEGPFEMVGAYPLGCDWDMCFGDTEEESEWIKNVKWFERDPIYGEQGPTVNY